MRVVHRPVTYSVASPVHLVQGAPRRHAQPRIFETRDPNAASRLWRDSSAPRAAQYSGPGGEARWLRAVHIPGGSTLDCCPQPEETNEPGGRGRSNVETTQTPILVCDTNVACFLCAAVLLAYTNDPASLGRRWHDGVYPPCHRSCEHVASCSFLSCLII